MRRIPVILTAAALVAFVAAGCGGQKAQQTSESSSDSLLAASPVEPPQGDLTPQQPYEQPTEQPAQKPPAPAPAPAPKPRPTPRPKPAEEPGVTIPAGTPIQLTVNAQISSETANVGDEWTGTVKEPVVVGTEAPIPAGSVVHGVVVGSKPAERGDRAFLLLSVSSITVNGKSHAIAATSDSIIAGSTRARNLGAIAGGAAAGALIGKAVGGSGKGALIGGLIGGAAATGAVAGSKGYQVVLKEGTEMTFNVKQATTIK